MCVSILPKPPRSIFGTEPIYNLRLISAYYTFKQTFVRRICKGVSFKLMLKFISNTVCGCATLSNGPPKEFISHIYTFRGGGCKYARRFFFNLILNYTNYEIVFIFKIQGLQLFPSRGVIIANQTLVLQGISKPTHGQYTCRASNPHGTITSNEVFLDIKCKFYAACIFSHQKYECRNVFYLLLTKCST